MMYIVFNVFLFVLDYFLCNIVTCIRHMVRKGICADVKTWITSRSWSFLFAIDSNSTVLHFVSLNKLKTCLNRSVTMSSINMEVIAN